MNSISFPKMFKNSSTTDVVYDKKASDQDVKLLIMSECGEFTGDPGFGANVRKYFFEQNGFILSDIISDDIYSKIKIFCPQLTVNMKDIEITKEKETFYATIKGINNLDFTPNLLKLAIFTEDERY